MVRYRFMVLVSVFTALVLVASLGSAQENEVYTDVGGWVIPQDVLQIIMNDTAIPPGFPSLQAHRDFARQFYVCDNNFSFDMVGLYVYKKLGGGFSNITQESYIVDYAGVYDPLVGQIVLIFLNNSSVFDNYGGRFDFSANSSFRLWFIVLDEGSFNKGFLVAKAYYVVWNSTHFHNWGNQEMFPLNVPCRLSENFSLASVMRGNITPATITETWTTTATATVTETRVETSTLTTTKTATETVTSTLTVSETYTTTVAATTTETTTITSPTTTTATTTLSYTTTVRELDETAVVAVGVGGLVLGIVASALLPRRR